jgi:polyferredoxin
MEIMLTAAIFPFIAIAVITLGSLTLGRTFCGWVCPFGYISDITSLFSKNYKISSKTNETLSKFAVFMAFLFIFIDLSIGYNQAIGKSIYEYFGEFAREPSSIITPTTTLFSLVFWYIYLNKYPSSILNLGEIISYPWTFWFRIFVLVIAIALNIIIPRAWCRYVCPLGGIMGIGSKYKLVKIWRDPARCDESTCGTACEKTCPMGIPILSYKGHVADSLCTSCGKCIDVCPSNGIYVKIR